MTQPTPRERIENLWDRAERHGGLTADEAARLREGITGLYATVQRLNRRAQSAESEVAVYRRAVAQWDVSERGTYIPHASLVAIGRAAGTDVLGSVRHLKHFERVEQAEAAIERVRKALAERRAEIADYEAENEPAPWSDAAANTCSRIEDALAEHPEPQAVRAALDEHQEQQPGA